MKIEIGTKLGKLTIIEYLKNDKYRYRCDCGNEGIRRGCSILKTKYPTCGRCISEGVRKRKLEQVKGTIKNNCKIIDGYYLETESGRRRLFVACECLKCHNKFEIRYDTLSHLHGDHCPQCNNKAKGQLQCKPHRGHKLWRIWWAMKDRCYNKKNSHYRDYGARGITICQDWLAHFEDFYSWSIAHSYGKGLSLDRIDNNKGYSPDNCRFVDQSIQNYNTRRNFFLWYNQKWCTVEEIAKLENVSYDVVYYRYVTRKSTRLPKKQLYDIDNIKK